MGVLLASVPSGNRFRSFHEDTRYLREENRQGQRVITKLPPEEPCGFPSPACHIVHQNADKLSSRVCEPSGKQIFLGVRPCVRNAHRREQAGEIHGAFERPLRSPSGCVVHIHTFPRSALHRLGKCHFGAGRCDLQPEQMILSRPPERCRKSMPSEKGTAYNGSWRSDHEFTDQLIDEIPGEPVKGGIGANPGVIGGPKRSPRAGASEPRCIA